MWNFLSRHSWRDREEILTSDFQCQSCGKKSEKWSDFEVYGLISPERARGARVDYELYKILICKDCYRAYIGNKCRRLVNLRVDTCNESQESERVKVEKSKEKESKRHTPINDNGEEKPRSRFEEIEL